MVSQNGLSNNNQFNKSEMIIHRGIKVPITNRHALLDIQHS
jgi:hypothetical protein